MQRKILKGQLISKKDVNKQKEMKMNFVCYFLKKLNHLHFQCFYVQKMMLKEIIQPLLEK